MDIIVKLSDEIENLDNPIEIRRMNGDIEEGVYVMKLHDFIKELSAATETDVEQSIETPLLPKNCIKHVWKRIPDVSEVYVDISKSNWDISYHNQMFYQVGFPRIIIKYRVEEAKCNFERIFAVAGSSRIKPDTPLYKFPYSHVSNDGQVCLGQNVLPELKSLQQLEALHALFFSAPFGDDYGVKSTSGMSLRELFTNLQNNEFDDELLIPINSTFNQKFGFGTN